MKLIIHSDMIALLARHILKLTVLQIISSCLKATNLYFRVFKFYSLYYDNFFSSLSPVSFLIKID